MDVKRWTLEELLGDLNGSYYNSCQSSHHLVSSLEIDSRSVREGSLFFALPGSVKDGKTFLPEAFKRGAVAAVVEQGKWQEGQEGFGGPIFLTPDSKEALAFVSKKFFADPTSQMLTCGVTGTNGKTTISWLLAEALSFLGRPVGHIGTLGLRLLLAGEILYRQSDNTTPNSVVINGFLAEARRSLATAASIECSSWGIEQSRLLGLEWDGLIYSNLTRDHLDLHHTFENYKQAKAKLFTSLLPRSTKQHRVALLNVDDRSVCELYLELCRDFPEIKVVGYSLQKNEFSTCYVKSFSSKLEGTCFVASICGEEITINSQLVGDYNVENLLAVASLLIALGFDSQAVSEALVSAKPVPGRLELVSAANPRVFIDYAHSPDSLLRAQLVLKKLTSGKLITVFGCGGDRDRGKRPLMGKVVRQCSDYAILTSDNPRSESPQDIVNDILPGITELGDCQSEFEHRVILDRAEAIYYALSVASPSDTILVAGKGHEAYQEQNGIKIPFSDQDVSRRALIRYFG